MRIQRDVFLRKVGGGSLRVTIPADIVRAFGLDEGDLVSFEADETGIAVKFFRIAASRTPAVAEEATA
jgi:antitoxin component of MazEF toxin-antitoxin module